MKKLCKNQSLSSDLAQLSHQEQKTALRKYLACTLVNSSFCFHVSHTALPYVAVCNDLRRLFSKNKSNIFNYTHKLYALSVTGTNGNILEMGTLFLRNYFLIDP